MKRCLSLAVAVLALVCVVPGPVFAAEGFGARLRGFEETPVPISTAGQGFLFVSLNEAESELSYSLVYLGVEGAVTQAHIHFGQPGVTGGIVLFLCTNLAPPAGVPAPPPCPIGPGLNTVNGTLTSAHVTPQAAQGIGAGDFAEVIAAMRAGIAYGNVHSSIYPPGEIRGQITR